LGVAAGPGFFLPLLAYLAACLAWGGMLARSERDVACLASGFAAAIIHHSWAAGFVYRTMRLYVLPGPELGRPPFPQELSPRD
jgi:hypothetical protein